jgi:hypothetical protein
VSLVIKVAKDESAIEHELHAATMYLSQLGPLQGRLCALDPQSTPLFDGAGVYYRQAHVAGEPLLDRLQTGEWPANEDLLRTPIRLCIDVMEKCDNAQPKRAASALLRLTALDISRLETSLEFSTQLGNTMFKRGLWPHGFPKPGVVAAGIFDAAKMWDNIANIKTLTPIQHGDLNPTNIIVGSGSDFSLIDLSRLGPWPIGYDMCRLGTMLRLRLMSSKERDDWFPDHLHEWTEELTLQTRIPPESSLCPEGAYCDRAFLTFAETTHNTAELMDVYNAERIWDLYKVISYQDISPFKRIWALLYCWRLLQELKKHVVA